MMAWHATLETDKRIEEFIRARPYGDQKQFIVFLNIQQQRGNRK
jgi:hypothetical protein